MTANQQLFQKYYEGWHKGQFDVNWFCDDFTFTGPLAQCTNVEDFFKLVATMSENCQIDTIDFKGQFFSDDGSSAVAIYDFITSKPIRSTTRTAEFFTFRNDKIASINLIYDAREWEKIMQEAPTTA